VPCQSTAVGLRSHCESLGLGPETQVGLAAGIKLC